MKRSILPSIICILLIPVMLISCVGNTPADDTSASPADTSAVPETTLPGTDETTVPETEAAPTSEYVLAEDGKAKMPVLIAANAASANLYSANVILQGMLDLTGIKFSRGNDTTQPTGIGRQTAGIVVGHTNRSDEKEFREELKKYGDYVFGIRFTSSSVIITSPSLDFVPVAADYFVDNFIKKSETEKGVSIKVTAPEDTVVVGSVVTPDTVQSKHLYGTFSEKVGHIKKDGNFKIMQGGCVNGEYGWFAMINTADYDKQAAGVYIYKVKYGTWEVIARSDVLMLDHANDITYLPETNQIAVAHCYVDGQKISLINADTLKIEGTLRSDEGAFYSVSYNADKKEFVCGTGKTNMLHFSADMKKKSLRNTETTTLTTQGICSDSSHVFHVLYAGSAAKAGTEPFNMIFVNSYLSGVLENRIRLSVYDQEPENISIVNGEFIIGCNNSSDSKNTDIVRTLLIDFGLK